VQQTVMLGRPCDVVRRSSAALAAERHVRIAGRRNLVRITLDQPSARGTAEWRSTAVGADEKKSLGGVVRVRTWLAHELSSYFETALRGKRRMVRWTFLTAIH
jgi:hypothetical protein